MLEELDAVIRTHPAIELVEVDETVDQGTPMRSENDTSAPSDSTNGDAAQNQSQNETGSEQSESAGSWKNSSEPLML